MRFNAVLQLVVEGGGEVDARQALYVVDGAGNALQAHLLAVVAEHEADGLGLALTAHDDLEESVGHPDVAAADGARRGGGVVDGAADDVDGAVFAGPVAALNLQVVPLIFVQGVVLRTDVRKQERLGHRLCVPLVVARRTHVAAVVARRVVVVVGGTRADLHILCEHLLRALVLAVGVALRQVPRHPVGIPCLLVIRGGIALAPENLLGAVGESRRALIFRHLAARRLRSLAVVERFCLLYVGIALAVAACRQCQTD